MLASLLVNLRNLGGRRPEWLKSQAERDKILKEDEELIALVTSIVNSEVLE